MIRGLFDAGTLAHDLRGGLEEASGTHRTIAQRVANARSSSSSDFDGQLRARTAAGDLDNEGLQQDMAALADTQLRYEATVRLLQQTYADLRTAVRDRG